MSSNTNEVVNLNYQQDLARRPTEGSSSMIRNWWTLFKQLPSLSEGELSNVVDSLFYVQTLLNQKHETGSFAHKIYQLNPLQPIQQTNDHLLLIPDPVKVIIVDLKRTKESEFTPEFLSEIDRFLSTQIALLRDEHQPQ